MAKNPISVGGLKQLLNKINEEVTQAAVKAAKDNRKGEDFEAEGEINVSGNFGFDKHGEFGFVGNVIGTGGAVDGDLGTTFDNEWNSDGDGTMRLNFRVSVKRFMNHGIL